MLVKFECKQVLQLHIGMGTKTSNEPKVKEERKSLVNFPYSARKCHVYVKVIRMLKSDHLYQNANTKVLCM